MGLVPHMLYAEEDFKPKVSHLQLQHTVSAEELSELSSIANFNFNSVYDLNKCNIKKKNQKNFHNVQ